MPTNISESDSFTSTVAMPEDGESADASELLTTTIQGIVNRTRYLKNRIDSVFSSLTVTGNVSVGDTLSAVLAAIAGHLTVGGNLTVSGNIGGKSLWNAYLGPDANVLVTSSFDNVIYVATMSTSRTYTLSASVTERKWFLFINKDASEILQVAVSGGGDFGSVSLDPLDVLLVQYLDGAWRILFHIPSEH